MISEKKKVKYLGWRPGRGEQVEPAHKMSFSPHANSTAEQRTEHRYPWQSKNPHRSICTTGERRTFSKLNLSVRMPKARIIVTPGLSRNSALVCEQRAGGLREMPAASINSIR
jgi:hypothetical protein